MDLCVTQYISYLVFSLKMNISSTCPNEIFPISQGHHHKAPVINIAIAGNGGNGGPGGEGGDGGDAIINTVESPKPRDIWGLGRRRR